jgi:hypothetical protein
MGERCIGQRGAIGEEPPTEGGRSAIAALAREGVSGEGPWEAFHKGKLLPDREELALEPLTAGSGEVEIETGFLRTSELNEAYEGYFAPGGAIFRPPTTLLEQKGLAGLEEMEGGMLEKEEVRGIA